MPIEIKVAPPGITISQGRTFMVTNSGGEINPQTDEGVFAIDTRFISYYHLFINRVPWVLRGQIQTLRQPWPNAHTMGYAGAKPPYQL